MVGPAERMIPQGEPDAVSVLLCEKTHCGRPALLLPLAETPLSWKSQLFLSCVCVFVYPAEDGAEYKVSQEQHGWFNISSHLSLIPPSAVSHPSHGAKSPDRAGSGRCQGGQNSLQGLLSHHVKLEKKVYQFKSTNA